MYCISVINRKKLSNAIEGEKDIEQGKVEKHNHTC